MNYRRGQHYAGYKMRWIKSHTLGALCLSMLVLSCAQQPMQVQWIEVDTEQELVAICGHKLRLGDPPIGCTVYPTAQNNTCTVYTRHRDFYKEMAKGAHDYWYYVAAGHELRHCRDGEWHK